MNRYKLTIKGKGYSRFIKKCIKYILKIYPTISKDIVSDFILECERLEKLTTRKVRKNIFKEELQ